MIMKQLFDGRSFLPLLPDYVMKLSIFDNWAKDGSQEICYPAGYKGRCYAQNGPDYCSRMTCAMAFLHLFSEIKKSYFPKQNRIQ